MTGRRAGRLAVAVAILLVAAGGFCLLDGGHHGQELCPSALPAAISVVLVGLLIVGAPTMPPAPPHPPLIPARAAPAPI